MNRRGFLSICILLAGLAPAGAHTPYGQWVVYRQKHLLIGSHRADLETWELAKKFSGYLADALPLSRSRVARAPNARRLASLLGTGQLDVTILSVADAVAMAKAEGDFAPYGRIPLRLLYDAGEYLLVAHDSFPKRHGWLVTSVLYHDLEGGGAPPPHRSGLAWHDGAVAFGSGEPLPPAE